MPDTQHDPRSGLLIPYMVIHNYQLRPMLIGGSVILSKGNEHGCKFLAPTVGKE